MNQEEQKNQAIDNMKKNVALKLESKPRFIMLDGVMLSFLDEVLNKVVPDDYFINEIILMTVPVQTSKLSIHNPKANAQMITMAYTLIEIIKRVL